MKANQTTYEKSTYYTKDVYILTTDLSHKKKHEVQGTDVKLEIATEYNNNHRVAHPNIGTIVIAPKNGQFKVGQQLICKHFTFESAERVPHVMYTKDGIDYFKATNFEVMFGIEEDGQLTPREGILLCEAIEGIFQNEGQPDKEHTELRRDIAKVLKVWDGCEDYVVGEYVLLAKGGDYQFTHDGKDYLKVDAYFNDVLATVDTDDWKINEKRVHITDYTQKHEVG